MYAEYAWLLLIIIYFRLFIAQTKNRVPWDPINAAGYNDYLLDVISNYWPTLTLIIRINLNLIDIIGNMLVLNFTT